MFYLVLAIISSALVSVCMRLSERHVHSKMTMFTANYAICLIISLFYTGGFQTSTGGMTWAVVLGGISGLLYLTSLTLFEKNIGLNGVILSSAAMKLGGVLIPVLVAVTVFREGMGWIKFVGVALAVTSVLLINVEKEDTDGGGKRLWLVVLLFASGVCDMMANVYDKTGAALLKNHYLFFTFLAAMLLSFGMACIKKDKATLPDILCGLVVGVPNYFSARFLLMALGTVPAVIAYPVFSVGTIIVVTGIGALAFREKLTRRKKAALLLILAALVLLNVGG